MAKMTEERWTEIRQRWESDPRDGFTWIVREMNIEVADKTVMRRAKRDRWTKIASLRSIVAAAQAQADKKRAERGQELSEKRTEGRFLSPGTESVDMRADVIDRHRQEWSEHRERFPMEAIVTIDELDPRIVRVAEGGSTLARTAKVVAETIRIRQQGERDAWGLDAIHEDPNAGMATLDELDAMYALAVERAEEMQKTMRKKRGEMEITQALAEAGG